MEKLIPDIDAIDFKDVDQDSRRKFLKLALSGATTMLLVYTPGVTAFLGRGRGWKQMSTEHQYAYVIDINKCIGWGGCVRACKQENQVPDDVFRTWVERYVITEDGGVYVDSPDGGLKGFPALGEEVRAKAVRSFFVPKMCNHCENPPCVQVCPVGATFKSRDGVVLVDEKYCVGCRYCIQACPYGARYMHPEKHVADKCTLCYHRITKGKLPACVEVCPTKARIFGELGQQSSPILRFIRFNDIRTLKAELNTKPKVFYAGADGEVR